MMNQDDLARRYADVLGEQPDPAVARLVTLLDTARACAPVGPAAQIDAAVFRALHAEAGERRHRPRPWWGGLLPPVRRRRVSLAMACAVVLSGVLGYLRLNGPTPVSAQTVLSRAAAAMRLAPNQAAHLIYQVAVTPPASGGVSPSAPAGPAFSSADVWIQTDGSGAPTLSSQTLTLPDLRKGLGDVARDKAARLSPTEAGAAILARPPDRYIQIGARIYGYERGNNAIVIPGTHDQHPGWLIPNEALDGATVAQELSALAQHTPQQVQLLPQQTLNGVTVDVLQVTGWADAPAMRTTFYFDARSFVLRGFDAASRDPSYPTASWQVWLRSYATLAAAAVPAHTFSLNAPADARIEAPRLDPAVFVSAFAGECHGTGDVNQLEQILQAKAQSLLAACLSTAPTVSGPDLVAALIAPFKAALGDAVTASQITAVQGSAALAAQQQWLAAFVTTPGGIQPPQ
jgi:hypothetical protein